MMSVMCIGPGRIFARATTFGQLEGSRTAVTKDVLGRRFQVTERVLSRRSGSTAGNGSLVLLDVPRGAVQNTKMNPLSMAEE
jgi:hypothetical protein